MGGREGTCKVAFGNLRSEHGVRGGHCSLPQCFTHQNTRAHDPRCSPGRAKCDVGRGANVDDTQAPKEHPTQTHRGVKGAVSNACGKGGGKVGGW